LYGQHTCLEIDIAVAQPHRLGNAKTGSGKQAEQCFVGDAPQIRFKPPRRREQVDDLPLTEDMRRQTLTGSSKDRVVGNFGARLKLL